MMHLAACIFLPACGLPMGTPQDPDPAALASWQESIRRSPQDPPPKAPAAQQPTGTPTQVDPRDNLRNEQQPAPRAGNQSLDPKFANYLQIPNTPVIMKFN